MSSARKPDAPRVGSGFELWITISHQHGIAIAGAIKHFQVAAEARATVVDFEMKERDLDSVSDGRGDYPRTKPCRVPGIFSDRRA